MRDARTLRKGAQAGFTIIELVVVVGIIGVLAGIALPPIAGYIRLYKIRGAATQVAGDLQAARNRAISKNANRGVDFVIGCNPPAAGCNNTYWIHHEDDQSVTHSTVRQTLNFTAPVNVQSTRYVLPQGIMFATTTAQCPPLVAAPTTGWLQYERLGNVCTTGCGTAPTTTAATNAIYSTAALSRICLYQAGTGLTRLIEVVPGGRVLQR